MAVQLMIGGVSLVVVALVLLGLTTQYTRRSTTLGYLRPDVGLVGVSSTRSGSLSIDVSNGDLVAQGQRLATIEGIGTSLDGTPFIDLELASLWDAINLIGERITLAQQQTIALNTQQDLAIKQHIRDIEAAIRLATTREEQTIFAAGQFVRTSDLFTDGVVASTAVDEAQQNLLAAEQEQENARAQLARLEAQTPQIEIDWKMRRVEIDQAINALIREQRSLEGQVQQLESQRETGIFAPIAGLITFSAAQEGEIVADGTTLFQITPQDSALETIVLAPSAAIGFVEVGDEIQIRYSAFPYREHGVFTGTVAAIDDTAQLPNAIRAPIQVAEPVYRIFVEIEQAPTSKRGDILDLAPGMTLEASIIIDQKPLLFWLLDPIL